MSSSSSSTIRSDVLYIHSTLTSIVSLLFLFYPQTTLRGFYATQPPVSLNGHALYLCMQIGTTGLALAAMLCMVAQRTTPQLMLITAACAVQHAVASVYLYVLADYSKTSIIHPQLLLLHVILHLLFAYVYLSDMHNARPRRVETVTSSSAFSWTGGVYVLIGLVYLVDTKASIAPLSSLSSSSSPSSSSLTPLAVLLGSNLIAVGCITVGFASGGVSNKVVNTVGLTRIIQAIGLVILVFVGVTPAGSTTALVFNNRTYVLALMFFDLCTALYHLIYDYNK